MVLELRDSSACTVNFPGFLGRVDLVDSSLCTRSKVSDLFDLETICTDRHKNVEGLIYWNSDF